MRTGSMSGSGLTAQEGSGRKAPLGAWRRSLRLYFVMAPAQGRFAPGAQRGDERTRLFGGQTLVPPLADHHHRRRVTGPGAFDLEQAESAACVGLADADAQRRRELLGDALGA